MEKKQLVYFKTDFKTFTDFCDFYTRKVDSMYTEAERINLHKASKKDLVNNECLLLERIVQDNSSPRFCKSHDVPSGVVPVEIEFIITPIKKGEYNVDLYIDTHYKSLVKQYFDQVKEVIPFSRRQGFVDKTPGITKHSISDTGKVNPMSFEKLNQEMLYKLAKVTDEVILLKKEEEQEA